MTNLASAYTKLDRAAEHFASLKAEIEALGQKPYEIVEVRAQSGAREWQLQGQPTPAFARIPTFPLIVGDIVHNARSALDHAVWRLADPPLEGVTGFPICAADIGDRRSFYGSAKELGRGVRMLKNVPQLAFEFIEAVQPYNRLGNDDPLRLLNDLWNIDKHRSLIILDKPTWNHRYIIATLNGRDLYPGEELPASPEDGVFVRLDAKSDSVVTFAERPRPSIVFGPDEPAGAREVLPTLDWLQLYVRHSVLAFLEHY